VIVKDYPITRQTARAIMQGKIWNDARFTAAILLDLEKRGHF
jgi:hypothetical protein